MLRSPRPAPVFTGNTIIGNFTAFYIVEGASAGLGDLSNTYPGDDGGNFIFDNVDMGGNTWSVYNASTADVKAENNSWDSTDPAAIALTIFDENDNPAFGLVDFDPLLNPAAVENDESSALENRLAIGCSPNPFVTETTLSFQIDGDSGADGIRLAIYDATGRLVKTLVDARLDPGRQAVSWDGRDETGRTLASGAYYYRLETERASQTGRMLRIR